MAVWQHLALGPLRFHLHVSLPPGFETKGIGWMGEAGMPSTGALAARVFALFGEGVPLQSVCTQLDLIHDEEVRLLKLKEPSARSPTSCSTRPWST